MDDGAPIRVVRHGNPSGPRVVLSHGNGFASDSYFPFWRPMLDRFDLCLFDFRNCGRNPFHAAEPHDYRRFVRDNVAVHAAIEGEWGRENHHRRLSFDVGDRGSARGRRRRLALGRAGAVRPADSPAGKPPVVRRADDRGPGAARCRP